MEIKKTQLNRYIELCNPFSRIINSFPWIDNSFPRIRQSILSGCNFFHRFRQSVLSICNSFSRIWQSVLSDCNSFPFHLLLQNRESVFLSNSRERIAILENDLCRSRERIAIRENGLSKSRERIIIQENELFKSREQIPNPWDRITNPLERTAQFDIMIYLWSFSKISMSIQGFLKFA